MHQLSHARRTVAALLAAAFALGTFAVAPVLATDRGDGLRAEANAARQNEPEGPMAPVAGTALLDDIADARADQMRDAGKLEHDMDYVKDRLARANVCWNKLGEIILYNYGDRDVDPTVFSNEYTINQWLNSTDHRAIMLDADYNSAGGSWASRPTGLTKYPNKYYAVMIFVRLCSDVPAQPSSLEPNREYSPDREMRLIRGEHRAFKFDANGKIVDTRTISLDRGWSEQSTGRTRVDGRAYLQVSSGALEGWWVRESPRQYVRGKTQHRSYSGRRIHVERGTYRAVSFDELGRVTDSVKASFDSDRRFGTGARAIINGRPWFKVSSGPFAGLWLRDNQDVRLAN